MLHQLAQKLVSRMIRLRALLDRAMPDDRAVVLAALDRGPRPPETTPAAFRKRLQRTLDRLRATVAGRNG